jgi:uncharacterized membrane protein
MAKSSLLVALAACAGVTLVSHDSWADFHICNKTKHTIWTTYATDNMLDDCGYDYPTASWGWFKVNPGGCATPETGDLGWVYSFVYGEDSYNHVWSGDWEIPYIPQTAFFNCCLWGTDYRTDNWYCGQAIGTTNTRTLYHFIVEINGYDNFTENLTL